MSWRNSTDGAPDVWTVLRERILTRYPGHATQLFELELQPIRRMAGMLIQSPSTTGSELAALREIGLHLIAEYLATVSGAEWRRRDGYLKHALDDALGVVAGKVKRNASRQRPRTTVQPVGGQPSDPPGGAGSAGDPSSIMLGPQHVSGSPLPRIDGPPLGVSAVPGARDAGPAAPPAPAPQPLRVPPGASHVVSGLAPPVPDAAPAAASSQAAPDLRLAIPSGVATLREGARELWRRADASFDWAQLRFSVLGDPSKLLTLEHVRGKLASWNREQTERFGGELAALLFGDPVPGEVIRALAVDAGSRRRLVLELDSNAAEAPWEYLHLNTGFIAERRLSIVRHVGASGTTHAHPLILEPPPAEIIFAYADPDNKTSAMQDHRERIEKALRPLKLPIHSRGRCTLDDVREVLQNTRADGFHFLGHGDRAYNKQPYLRVYADNKGTPDRLFADKLAPWLAGSKARFVFLGACHSGDTAPGFSGIAEAIVRESGIPVIAMQLAVPQEFSTNFAVNFYERLVSGGYDLERAVYEARQFQYAERHAFGIPVLFADVDKDPRPVPELPAPPPGAWATFAVIAAAPQPPPPPKIEDAPLPVIDRAIIEPVDDVELEIDWDTTLPALAKLHERYALAEDLLKSIASELAAGRHVVLTGPVGTGKTTIASDLVRALGYRPYVVTASAEWTSFEVVGGFFPHALKDGATHRVDFAWRPGVFLEAVHANWDVRNASEELSHWHRRTAPGQRGTWLVLDELNRADMDRALGGVFTALESLRLRIPVASVQPGSPVTVEIPIPKDFRILATMNGVDRHYLFRLSDALKRRFAFIEVGVSEQLGDEWQKVLARCEPGAADLDEGERRLHDDLRRFVYLARAFYPVGTAQLLAALRFVIQSRRAGLSRDARLCQALAGSILPGLEEAPRELLGLLRRWSETRNAEALAAAIGDARALWLDEAVAAHGAAPRLPAQLRGMVTQLEALRDGESIERAADLDGDSDDQLLRRFAQRVVRRGESGELPRLRAQLSAMVRS